MHELVRISEKVEKEIGKIADKPALTMADIEAVCKAVDVMEKIEKTLMLREESMEREEPEMYGRQRYGMTRYGNQPDRYSSRNRQYGYYGTDYNRMSEKDQMIDKLESMMASSGNEQHRQVIAECVDRINRLGN